MPETRNEPQRRDSFRIRPGELLAILLFWSFLAALTATGRLLDPRLPELRADVRSALIALAFIEYSIWAALTVPIFWLVSHVDVAARRRYSRRAGLVILGVAVALGVNLALSMIRTALIARPPGGMHANGVRLLSPMELVGDLMICFAIMSAAMARNYFLRYQLRLDDTRRLKAEAAELQAQLAQAQLAVLRTQLNPHFLFNTLHAVSSLVERDPRGVRRMIARLSDLLRHTLEQTSEQEVPLERELDLLRRYLEIMEVRFQGRLKIALDVDETLKDALVPNLILQPLVENALKHGVNSADDAGTVEIRAQRDGGSVVLSVRDSGPGPRDDHGSSGVGIRNTIDRLSRLYGPRGHFSLSAAQGGGSVATVVLPFHTAAA